MISEELKEQVYSCIRCGLCMNVCPVYRQLLYEGVSPRGKIQLIRLILEDKLDITENFSRLLGTCLLCETCAVNCPSGVKLDRLMKAMRAEVVGKFKLPWQKRAVFHLLSGSHLLPFVMSWGRTLETPLRTVLPKDLKAGTIPLPKLPRLNHRPFMDQYPEVVRPAVKPVGRVYYFVGCATNYISENVGHSVVRVLGRLGVEVVIPKRQTCCGFPICLAGARKPAMKNVRRNLAAFDPGSADAIVTDCATCGAALKKEYVNLLEEAGQDARKAREFGEKILDISEYLARFDFEGMLRPVKDRVTYHDPCHLVRTMGVKEEPRSLLRRIPGLEFVEMAGADVCCGGGGTFQMDHPELASGITKNKIQSILDTCAQTVATGCPGCRLQIHGNLENEEIRVLHPVELLAKAMGLVDG
jgi:glycolate oxidase iron-sulfur subunit